MSTTVVPAGGTITITCVGFAANITVTVTLFSDPVQLATIRTNSRGEFSAPVTIPASTRPGPHTLRVSGVDASGNPRVVSIPIVVTAAGVTGDGDRGRGGLSRTGASATIPLTAAGVGLLGIGTAAVIVARRRRLTAEDAGF